MRVLIACEESQRVALEFRKLGHEAYSCDLEEAGGGHDLMHLNVDALQMLKLKWDLVIAHPPCTYLTVTGNRGLTKKNMGTRHESERPTAKKPLSFSWLSLSAVPRTSQLRTQLAICQPNGESQTK